MNKNTSVAYAQIALDYMQSSKYNGEINPDTLAIEMRQAFKLYPQDTVLFVAESQRLARKDLKKAQNGSDTNGE